MADTASSSQSTPLQGSVDRVRTSARWLLGAFGAIGVALAVGAQFSNLGKLEGSNRDWALVGVVLTFGGLGLAIGGGSSVLTPRMRSLKQLAEREHAPRPRFRLPDPALSFFETAPELLVPFASVTELWNERVRLLGKYAIAFKKWTKQPTEANAKALSEADAHATPVEDVAQDVIAWANYSLVRATYTRAVRFAVFPGVVLAAVGLTIFALKIPDVPPAAATPAEVRLEGINLKKFDLHGVTLHGADLTNADLESTELVDADLSGATLNGANLAGADLTNANLAKATLKNAGITGVTWRSTTCPDGRLSNDVGGSCAAHLNPPRAP